jgi:hypothetical protein
MANFRPSQKQLAALAVVAWLSGSLLSAEDRAPSPSTAARAAWNVTTYRLEGPSGAAFEVRELMLAQDDLWQFRVFVLGPEGHRAVLWSTRDAPVALMRAGMLHDVTGWWAETLTRAGRPASTTAAQSASLSEECDGSRCAHDTWLRTAGGHDTLGLGCLAGQTLDDGDFSRALARTETGQRIARALPSEALDTLLFLRRVGPATPLGEPSAATARSRPLFLETALEALLGPRWETVDGSALWTERQTRSRYGKGTTPALEPDDRAFLAKFERLADPSEPFGLLLVEGLGGTGRVGSELSGAAKADGAP